MSDIRNSVKNSRAFTLIELLVVIAIIGVFAFVDIIVIDTKYLSSDNFQDKEENG